MCVWLQLHEATVFLGIQYMVPNTFKWSKILCFINNFYQTTTVCLFLIPKREIMLLVTGLYQKYFMF